MVGLHKFDDLESMEDARDRVQNAVNMLTSSCLLLDVEDDESYTKMHDVVRYVALLIASQGENKYLVKAGKFLRECQPVNKSLERYMGVSLMNNRISKLPDYEVNLPIVDIFIVNNNDVTMISDEFILSMKEVKVLDLSKCRMTQLPQSLELLTKLRLLNLSGNSSIHEISIIGEMKKLEILTLNDTGVKEIPNEIGQLVNLRWLEVCKCRYSTRVAPGVISKLQCLEELCIDLIQMSEGVNDCTTEVMKLSNLLTLYIESCSKLERVFTMRVAQGLVNLKFLIIDNCDGLEEVIYGGDGDDASGNVIVFSSLITISLYLLPRLKRFFNSAGNCSIKYPSVTAVTPVTAVSGEETIGNPSISVCHGDEHGGVDDTGDILWSTNALDFLDLSPSYSTILFVSLIDQLTII